MANYACMGWTVHGPCLRPARFLVSFAAGARNEGACTAHLTKVVSRRLDATGRNVEVSYARAD